MGPREDAPVWSSLGECVRFVAGQGGSGWAGDHVRPSLGGVATAFGVPMMGGVSSTMARSPGKATECGGVPNRRCGAVEGQGRGEHPWSVLAIGGPPWFLGAQDLFVSAVDLGDPCGATGRGGGGV